MATKNTPETTKIEPSVPSMTVAEMKNAWEPIQNFFQKFADLGPLLQSVASIDQLTGESLNRRDAAIAAADQAEKDTQDKLALFDQKITRASEEAGRILQKARQDADTTRAQAEEQALGILQPARMQANTALAKQTAAENRLTALERELVEKQKTLTALLTSITAAQTKIAEFSK